MCTYVPKRTEALGSVHTAGIYRTVGMHRLYLTEHTLENLSKRQRKPETAEHTAPICVEPIIDETYICIPIPTPLNQGHLL